jgi:N-acetylglucosaminyldiphosphoundecaprenol N-acetyl-beta-D-mannosaminyltransferase
LHDVKVSQETSESLTQQRDPVTLAGVQFDPILEKDVVNKVLGELSAGRGGQIITPNVDILHRAVRSEEARRHIAVSEITVADGKPLIWASQIAGKALPARVAGSDLIWSLSEAMAGAGRSVYLLGGEPGTAERAEAVLRERFPSLKLAGHLSPSFGFDTRSDEYDAVCDEVVSANPDMVFVGFGFPKQERVIERLRPRLPQTWFMGCGAAIGFVAGVHSRAPEWMQKSGLEWVHRLAGEPRRLMKRYLVDDAPFALRLLGSAAVSRFKKGDAR